MSTHDERIGELLVHRTWLERLARRLARDPHTADDAVQLTWLHVLRAQPERSSGAKAWLRTVLVREIAQIHRRQTRRREHETLVESVVPRADEPWLHAEAEDLHEELAAALRTLPEPYRTTLRLRFFEGRSSREIAERLGIPAATVRSRVMAGLLRLRDARRRDGARVASRKRRSV